MSLRVGLTPPWDLARLAPDEQRARMAAIADAGIDHVFTADHVSFIDGSGTDGLIRLAALSGLEPRLDLYLGVYLLALRHPMVVARQIATLAESAPGRLTVGVGVGGEDRHEFEVCGVDPKTRGRRTDVSLDLVRRLLAGETVDGDGEFFDIEAGSIKPSPNPAVPFIVGGRSNAALQRAGALGDGWLATWCSPRRFREGLDIVESLGADRSVGWQHGMQLWAGIGPNPAAGKPHVAERMFEFYKLDFEAFAKYTPVGNAEDIAEFLMPYVEAGATTINLSACAASREEEIETIGEVGRLLNR